ncbi:hypothetical protein ACGFX4_32280 [Kitasatospora sp. NPDC048365]|uniref:hypothetical protein n=1 Tax=Kitasatospora sp. NPDC048365 TaxID=3364050 RepID=UPI0037230ECE
MSTNRSRRIDRDTAEQLLGGDPVGSEAGQASLTGQAALAGLLAAAKAPAAGPAEGALPGEEQVMAAFRAARHSTAPQHLAPQHRRRTMADTALARAFSAKALAAALAATAVGGVAFAASTGNLPTVLGGHGPVDSPALTGGSSHSAGPGGGTDRPGGDPSGRTGTQPGGTAKPSADASGTAGASAGASGDPSQLPDLAKLCKTVGERTGNATKLRELLAEESMQPLVKAAGGADKVAPYCANVVGKGNASPGNASPGDHGKPSPTPTASSTKGEREKTAAPSADQKAARSSDSGG